MLKYSHKTADWQIVGRTLVSFRPSWQGSGLPSFLVCGLVALYFEGLLFGGLRRFRFLFFFEGCLGDETCGKAEEVVVVMNDGGEGDAAGLGDILAQQLGGQVGEEVGTDFGDLLDTHHGGPCRCPQAYGVGGDFSTLKGHRGLRGNDVTLLV